MADATAPQPRRALSRESWALPPRNTNESAFADFLSDGSGSEADEDEDDADTRALLRMQQQADDSAYSDVPKTLLDPVKAEPEPESASASASAGASVDDVMELVSLVERTSRVLEDQLSLGAVASGSSRVESDLQSPKRKTSVRETESSFADFLSDGSNSSDEEEDKDDAETRALLRMQQQADDRTYEDTSFKIERPPTGGSSSSFRLTMAKPGVFDAHGDGACSGPKKLVEQAMGRGSAEDQSECKSDDVTDEVVDAATDEVEAAVESSVDKRDDDSSFVDDRPNFNDANSFTEGTGVGFVDADASDSHDSLASRPPRFDAEGDSFFDEPRPSFSDEHSFTGGDSFTAVDNSFVYRPSLPDDDDETQNKVHGTSNNSFVDSSFVYRPTLPDNEGSTRSGERDHLQPDSLKDSNFVYQPARTGSEEETQNTDTMNSNISLGVDNSFVYRPTLPDHDILDIGHNHTRTASPNILTAEENIFVYLPTLPSADDETQPNTVAQEENEILSNGIDYSPSASGEDQEDEDEPSFLSPSASSFIRSSDAVAFKFGDIDSSFRLHEGEAAAVVVEDDSFSSVLTDSCASSEPPKLGITQEPNAEKALTEVPAATTPVRREEDNTTPTTADSPISTSTSNITVPIPSKRKATPAIGDKAAQGADTNIEVGTFLSADISIKLPLSRQSSAASSTGPSQDFISQQRRMTATRESWRISSLDFRESKHAFDEELGPLAGQQQSPRASAVESEQQRHRLSSMFEERSSAASASSTSSSLASFHSQPNFFVDDIQQSFSSVSSLSLDSRPSGDDSFTNVAILGDDVRDQNERRSSDVISQDVGELRSSSVSAAYPTASDTLDRSYSDLVDVAAGLDRSFSKLVDREGFCSNDGDRSSANISAIGTSLVSSLGSSAVSQSSAASDELPFVSFNAAKPPSSTGLAQQLKQTENKEQHLSTTAQTSPDRQKLANESVFYRSIVLPRGDDIKAIKPSRSPSVTSSTGATSFSSAALLAAIKTRDARTDTRSEETEAGDVALGALPLLAPPLKINLVSQGRGSLSSSFLSKSAAGSSPSISASPLAMSSVTRSSVASSTGTADRLDFTGVYRGSVNSLEASGNNGVLSRTVEPEAATKLKRPKQKSLGGLKDTIKVELLGVKLERSISDSRTMQREARLKVEDFFRRTYQKDVDGIDEQEVHRSTNRKTRARTTVIQCVDDAEEEPCSFAFNGNSVAKIIDLKNLRNGGKRPGWHLEDDVIPLTPEQEEESAKQGAMATTTGTTSTGTTATRSMPSDLILMPPNYVISPQAAGALKLKEQEKDSKTKAAAGASGGGHSSFFSGPGGDDVSRFGAVSGRRADNVSLTPTLPRLSANESPALSPSPFATSFVTPNAFGGSGGVGIGRSPGKSPVAFAGTASGFLWKTGSGFNGFKRSAVDTLFGASRVSFSQRSTLAGRVQSLSASLASTLRRFWHGKDAQQHNGNVDVTSPQSQCMAPAALPRAYDHNGFYEAPFKVPDLNKPLPQREKKQKVESDSDWIRQWLILATCAVLGLSLGAVLVCVVDFNASVFNLSAVEVHERRGSNGELVFATGVRWLLLPGHLFVRVWSAVTTPLLVCYVVNALSDLVGCADKSTLVLSFRSIGYALLLAMLATVEGVLAMWITHKFGWFKGSSSTASSEASILSDAIGVTPLPEGVVGLLCADDGEYLQRLGHDVFACSNASLVLPLYEEVSTNSTDSGPAVFALQEVTQVLATPTLSLAYYPSSLGSGGDMTTSLLSALTPDNLASQYTEVASDGLASLSGLVVFALLLGYVCGKRILRLRRDAQAAMFESVRSNGEDPHKARHYIVGLLMELQLALEWLVGPMEWYLAPLGFFSLMLGHVVRHHREWRSFTSPMSSLIVGILILIILHAVVVLPTVLKQFSRSRRRLPLLTTTRAFVPTFLFAFTTDNVALSAPVTMQCYARVLTVTRSGAQLATAVTAALIQNARALYLPLLLLWLLVTSSSEELELSTSDYFSVGILSLLSCFCGGSTRLTLAMARTLWSTTVSDQSSSAASLLPATMPLLVVCDVVLSRVTSVVTVADHLVLTELAAQHWAETVVHGPASSNRNSHISSPSPLDDSQAPRPPSSALLSSVYL